MILKNLLRRKGRTILTVLGVSIGVATIVILGSLANGLEAGYSGMLSGSKADLILSQPDSYDLSLSTVKEEIGVQLAAMPEVKAVSGMLEGMAQTEGVPYFFIFGYPEDSFVLSRFQITGGVLFTSRQAGRMRGQSIMLGSAAAETLKKSPGDVIRVMGQTFRVVGIYQTGDAFEDNGAVLSLEYYQRVMGKNRQVSLFYVQLKDPALKPRLEARIKRLWPDLLLGTTQNFTSSQGMAESMRWVVWVVSGLAILIGGVGMMNAQLMAVFERTREIGVLRAVGWSRMRVLLLILGESMVVCGAGGLMGMLLAWLALKSLANVFGSFGVEASQISPVLLAQSGGVALALGIAGGLYPAWHASTLPPVEALRYEGGGSSAKLHRFPLGGMAVQSLWQRSTRTVLTLSAISLTVGAVLAIDGWMDGLTQEFTALFSTDSEVVLRQKEVSDTSQSALDERLGAKIAALPEVQAVSGMVITAVMMPGSSAFFIIQGYAPSEYAIRRFEIVEGKPLSGNHQVLVGQRMAKALKKVPGDTITLSGTRFRVQGIYVSGIGWEEMGGVVSLRDAQTLVGRPRKVTIYTVKMRDPAQSSLLVDQLNREYQDVHAALTGDFVDQMPDMTSSYAMMNSISLMAILAGGLGMMNTMLMSVLERTREIGVLRAVGWRRRDILWMILKEAALLGFFGGLTGILFAFGLDALVDSSPVYRDILQPLWSFPLFIRAIGIAMLLGLAGGLYPALRATRQEPVEALRYE